MVPVACGFAGRSYACAADRLRCESRRRKWRLGGYSTSKRCVVRRANRRSAMKILIAYDGSECSNAAIADLRRAGLPAVADVMVLSVAEISPQVMAVPYGVPMAGSGMFLTDEPGGGALIDERLHEFQAFAAQAAERLRADFP